MQGAPDVIVRRMGQLKQHHKNVIQGKSLPTTKDLLRLCPYMSNELRLDMQIFADIAARRVRSKTPGAPELKQAFRNLTLEGANLKDVLNTCRVLRAHGYAVLGMTTAEAFLIRCELYAASFNHKPMVDKAWRRCFQLAAEAEYAIDAFHYLQAALGWRAVAGRKHWPKEDLREIQYIGESTLDLAFRVWESMRMPSATSAHPKVAASTAQDEIAPESPALPGHLTVLEAVGNADLMMGKRIAEEFKKVIGVPLPLTRADSLQEVRTTLAREFPWASSVTQVLLADIGSREWVYFRPTILLGTPGCGKTRYCNRFLKLLGIKYRVFNCGGVADSSFGGTARHWSNTQPSLPLSLVRQFGTANPGIVLDEIDKASDSRHNGSLFDALLAMTEPESAATCYDPYIQGPVNLSSILWLATANDAADIPAPLRDRFRILAFNEPTADHLEALARALMTDLVAEQGMRPEWARPLSWEELDALWKVWDGGSVRALRRYLEGVLKAREAATAEAEPH